MSVYSACRFIHFVLPGPRHKKHQPQITQGDILDDVRKMPPSKKLVQHLSALIHLLNTKYCAHSVLHSMCINHVY